MRTALYLLFGILLCLLAFGAGAALVYTFASTIERGYGGCRNFIRLCEHPLTVGSSLGAGVIAAVAMGVIVRRAFVHGSRSSGGKP